jgi:hypothetical protein
LTGALSNSLVQEVLVLNVPAGEATPCSLHGVDIFRYVSTDWAQVVVDDLTDTHAADEWNTVTSLLDVTQFPAPFTAYPFFIFYEPGVSVIPPSNFSIALSVASTLTSHGHIEASLKWYELAFDPSGSPLSRDNSWKPSGTPPDDMDPCLNI